MTITRRASSILTRDDATNDPQEPAELFLLDQTDAQAGIVVPTIPGWVGVNAGFNANRAFFSRFTLLYDRTISSVKFRSNGAGTGNVDVCIIDAAGNILRSSGSTSGKKGANTWQTVPLSSPLALTAGTVYYVGLVSSVGDGTYDAVFWNVSSGLGLDQMWGSTLGLCQSFFKDLGAFPFSGTITVGSANGAVGPIAGLI